VLLPVLLATLVGAPPALAWTWPSDGPVLQPFTFGDDPYAAGQHRGIDVAGTPGSPVRAPAQGSVTFAGTVPGGGRTVTILTPDGYAVTLLHLGAIGVRRGAAVDEAAAVGTLGSSGEAEHPVAYVHLGVRVASEPQGYLDPLRLLPPQPPGPAEGAAGPQDEATSGAGSEPEDEPAGADPAAPAEAPDALDVETGTADAPVEAPAGVPVEVPAETPAGVPAESPTEVPVADVPARPGEVTAEAPGPAISRPAGELTATAPSSAAAGAPPAAPGDATALPAGSGRRSAASGIAMAPATAASLRVDSAPKSEAERAGPGRDVLASGPAAEAGRPAPEPGRAVRAAPDGTAPARGGVPLALLSGLGAAALLGAVTIALARIRHRPPVRLTPRPSAEVKVGAGRSQGGSDLPTSGVAESAGSTPEPSPACPPAPGPRSGAAAGHGRVGTRRGPGRRLVRRVDTCRRDRPRQSRRGHPLVLRSRERRDGWRERRTPASGAWV
jgi:hypothetical protein